MRKDRRNSSVFETMFKNNMADFLIKIRENKKKKEGMLKQKQKLEANKHKTGKPLPPATTDSKLVKNYEVIMEIIDLVKEENVALDKAVNEIFNHNRFIRDKAIENEKKMKVLLNNI
jgi:hypothetical protein